VHSRLVSRTSRRNHFWVVVKDLEKGCDNAVGSASVLDIRSTVLVDLRLSVVKGLVGTPGSSVGTEVSEVRVQRVND